MYLHTRYTFVCTYMCYNPKLVLHMDIDSIVAITQILTCQLQTLCIEKDGVYL